MSKKSNEALLYAELTEVDGKTLHDILHTLHGLLRVNGPRALTASTENGAIVHASLYDDDDYILNAAGRLIYHAKYR